MRTTHPWAAFGSAVALALLLVAGEGLTAPPTTEAATSCRVRNVTQDTTGRSLKRMVRNSRDGDRLIMRGTCDGTVGIRANTVISGRGTRPTITGRGERRVVRVTRRATVVLRGLRVLRGRVRGGYNGSGGGILNAGRLTLREVIVRGNRSVSVGGGIYNKGALTLIGSRIIGNIASWVNRRNTAARGGGIFNQEDATLTLSDSTVRGNRGGGIWSNRGEVTITASTVRGNGASSVAVAKHGGIVNSRGRLTITDSAIRDNTGGGVYTSGAATLTDSTVTGNTATTGGGGIYAKGPVTLVRSTVSGNKARYGGGIYVIRGSGFKDHASGKVILVDSEVTANTAGTKGGGIQAAILDFWGEHPPPPEVTLEGTSSVHDNVPDDCVGTTAC